MRVVPLSTAPNQEFTVTLDAVRWVLRFASLFGVMSVSIQRDGVTLLENTRALCGEALIPYQYLQTGNFIFISLNDALPQASLFGSEQFLVYLSAEEISALAVPTVAELSPFEPSFLIDDNGFYLTTDTGELLTDD